MSNNDKYFDFICDLFDDINNDNERQNLCLLDNHKSQNFFKFCMENMNKQDVDNYIKDKEYRRIMQENRDIIDNDTDIDNDADCEMDNDNDNDIETVDGLQPSIPLQ